MRVRFSFAGLSGETSPFGPAQTVSAADDQLYNNINTILISLMMTYQWIVDFKYFLHYFPLCPYHTVTISWYLSHASKSLTSAEMIRLVDELVNRK